jgi:hypothetical protein
MARDGGVAKSILDICPRTSNQSMPVRECMTEQEFANAVTLAKAV